MLRFISKQAQNLTINDDAAIGNIVRPLNNFTKEELRRRDKSKRQRMRDRRFNNAPQKNIGSCKYCKGPLDFYNDAVTGRVRKYCPACNPPK